MRYMELDADMQSEMEPESPRRLTKFMDISDEELFVEERLIIYLLYLKITPNLKGHAFLKACVMKILSDSSKKRNMTNCLYKEVAQENNIAVNLIDRSMRHALLVSFKKDGIGEFERKTGYSFPTCRPTPREAICMLVELVNMDRCTFRSRARR